MNKLKLFFNAFTPLIGAALFAAAIVRGVDIHTVTGKVDIGLIPLGLIGLAIAIPYQIALTRDYKKRQVLEQQQQS